MNRKHRRKKRAAPESTCHFSKHEKSRITATECSKTLVKWCHPACNPKNWQSSMCEIEVSGCQFPPWERVKAQNTPLEVKPVIILGFSKTYSGSSRLMNG